MSQKQIFEYFNGVGPTVSESNIADDEHAMSGMEA